VLFDHCVDIGRDPAEIVRSSNFNVICEETEAAVEDRIRWLRDRYSRFLDSAGLDRIEAMIRPMAGTPEQLIERLRPWKEAGLAYAIVYFPDAAYSRAGIERFAVEVCPALQ